MNRSRAIVVLILTAALAVATTAPVLAAGEYGQKTCTSNYTMYVTSRSAGETDHFLPGGVHMEYQNGGSMLTRTTYDSAPGTSGQWSAWSTGAMDYGATYAGCWPSGS